MNQKANQTENLKTNIDIELTNLENPSSQQINKADDKNIGDLLNNNEVNFNNTEKINQFFDNKRIQDELLKTENIDGHKIQNENANILDENENLINPDNTIAVNRKFSENNNSENIINKAPIINEMKDITPILEKFERKKKKKENVPEGPIR